MSSLVDTPIPELPTAADRIRAVRSRLELTKTALAEALGTTRFQVLRWERGRACPSRPYAERLAELTGYPAELFLEDRRRR